MDLIIEVKDAAGTPISGADVAVVVSGDRKTGKTDGKGQVVLRPLPNVLFTVEATHPLYLEEEVDVIPPNGGGSFVWGNPVCTVTPPATVIVHLSRIRPAPLFPISDAEMKQRDSFNPKAVFTWKDNAGNPTNRYLGIFNNEEIFVRVNHPLLPAKPTEGWGRKPDKIEPGDPGRLNHSKPIKIEPNREGNLIWLEWGIGDKSPRLLVAVWVPRWRGTTPSKLDFVIFFSPNTAIPEKFPARKEEYPYMAWKIGDRLVQPYPGLGHRYLFREKWLVYQLLAAKRQAVVVFPVQPYGNWGPFADAAGLSRLLAEVTHFLHRMGYTSGGQSSRDEDRAPVPPQFRFNRIHQPPPTVRRVVIGGFSAGVGPIADMLPTTFGQKMDDTRFNINGIDGHTLFGADVAPFLNAWKEVWDHDAPSYIRSRLDKDLPGWLQRDSQRMARCYQTDDTGSKGWIETTPLIKFTSGPTLKPTNGLIAAERHAEDRCSLVYFGSGYLKHTTSNPAIFPMFWGEKDDHQAVTTVTFGHAALLSGLAKF
ncbi:carboxypeptidase regulatory-like domain-containing protein [Paenibacillus sp. 7124]|uniref:Carboxypeptidase regulatory-like domain-containing protein n=1 Tax=Paenibacillus apii TaxID=1850370 RepID=A0A6M1PNG1_9BACL|nr:carboxypeptidase-like regulatory domain-containing protein [Paenibacillus apii]NGM84018.1 carboxypeptidase regulatory-like domain-containing protein [Paenibacillus apii]NJJ38802.1 carboxypeptidase regulatory-like domain-containing protein [Paenibacillus apii]